MLDFVHMSTEIENPILTKTCSKLSVKTVLLISNTCSVATIKTVKVRFLKQRH